MPHLKRTPDQIAADIQEQHKTCSVCGERKHFDLFYNFKNKSDGKSYRCKSCDDLARKKWSDSNPERAYRSARSKRLKHLFNLTIEDYENLLEEQEGKCAICGVTENKTVGTMKTHNFCVDHDHETGKVRGLLCNNCNRGLGLLKDSEELLRKAARYVENYRETH
jgi:hypothetical protein